MGDPRYKTPRWHRLRNQVIRRDGRICAKPGCIQNMHTPRMTQVDHIIETKDGGDFWDPLNCQVLCFPHHREKTAAAAAARPVTLVSPNA